MDKGQIVKTTNGLKVGDWVYLEQYDNLYKGYVTAILGQTHFTMFCVSYTSEFDSYSKEYKEYKEYSKVSTNTSSYRIFKETKQFTFKDLENKTHLIDIALDTKDNDWLRELVN